MRTQQLQSTRTTAHQAMAYSGAIAWEELPSLFDTPSPGQVPLVRRAVDLDLSGAAPSDSRFRRGVTWDNTMPADLDPAVQPEPFSEPLKGLAMREVREPDVFRHFFG